MITSKVRSFADTNFGTAHLRLRGHLSAAVFCFFWSGTACLAYGAPGDTQLVSVSTITNKAAGFSSVALGTPVSYGGRYVAFDSNAKNLIPGPSSQFRDIYVRDRNTSSTERVSVALNGEQTNGDSLDPSISADGRYVAFTSNASNLAPDSDPGRFGWDIFVRDRLTGQTELVSVNSSGEQANQESQSASISSDGRYVVFSSYATNLAPGIDNGWDNVFIHDRQTGLTEWVSVGLNGAPPNSDCAGRARAAHYQRRRTLRDVRVGCLQSRARGHQRGGRRLRPRSPDEKDHEGECSFQWHASQWTKRLSRTERRWPVRIVPVRCH